jgi:protein-S-isoprenylcysteine O-methyltransferase Ste14
MLLRENLELTGQWLFRWRSYLPLVLIALLPTALSDYRHPFDSHRWDLAWELGCFGVSLVGLAIRVLTLGHAPAGTSGRNQRRQCADELNITGLYSCVRNPLYLGNYFMYLGVALMPRLWWLPALLTLGFALYYERIVFAEERFLESKFGDAYRTWAGRTPAFFPRLRLWMQPRLPFAWRTALKREYLGLGGLIGMFVLVELAENFVVYGRARLDLFWQILGGGALAAFLFIRFLRKRTALLDDPGR